jgi:hypothetical protein
MKINKFTLTAALAATMSLSACTDLVEKPFSEAEPQNYFVNAASFEAALVPAYASLRNYIWNYWNLSEHTSDELQGPTRGGDWGDGGQWVRLNNQELLPTENLIDDLWGDLFTGISRSNNAIATFAGAPDSVKEKVLFIAEAKALRAFYYYLLLDTFGPVPIVTVAQSDPLNPPKQATRAEVFAFVESELKAATGALLETPPYGRISKGAANALLANINSLVWTGTARNAEAIAAADAVIGGGKYSLTGKYFDNFKLANEGSSESIMIAAFSSTKDLGFPNNNFYMRTLHYNMLPAGPWNGFTTIAEIYDSFDAKDERRQVMWIGQQYEGLTWPAANAAGKKVEERSPGVPLIFTKDCPIFNANESNGIRVPKYQPDVTAPGGQGENDFVILRLADIMLIKAEALVRSGNTAAALPIVNTLRKRVGLTDLTSITLDGLYKERTLEMFWEGVRRQDQIRFGKFLDKWTNKAVTTSKVLLFPIPAKQLSNNPNLKQNPGY